MKVRVRLRERTRRVASCGKLVRSGELTPLSDVWSVAEASSAVEGSGTSSLTRKPRASSFFRACDRRLLRLSSEASVSR